MGDAREAGRALAQLRAVVATVDAGALSCRPDERAYLHGAMWTLELCFYNDRTVKGRLTYTAAVGTPVRALGYVRVSTEEQADSGAGLAAQTSALRAEAQRRGWALELVEDAGYSGKDLKRPGLAAALDQLDRRDADVLVVSKLDRLSRSVRDFGGLLDRATKRGWSVVCLDLGVDTTTPVGEFTANVVASASQYERRLIGQRTRDALRERRAAGVVLGRPRVLGDDVVGRILSERRKGRSLRAIADALTNEGVTTARGGPRWSASSVQAVLQSRASASPETGHQAAMTGAGGSSARDRQ